MLRDRALPHTNIRLLLLRCNINRTNEPLHKIKTADIKTSGPSRSTLWRRAQRQKAEESKRIEQLERSRNAEHDWQDIDRLVEKKWPMVTKDIRATILFKGIIL